VGSAAYQLLPGPWSYQRTSGRLPPGTFITRREERAVIEITAVCAHAQERSLAVSGERGYVSVRKFLQRLSIGYGHVSQRHSSGYFSNQACTR